MSLCCFCALCKNGASTSFLFFSKILFKYGAKVGKKNFSFNWNKKYKKILKKTNKMNRSKKKPSNVKRMSIEKNTCVS